MEKFLYVTNTSSVLPSAKRLGKPPSPTGEGFCKSRFWATDGCAAVTDTTLDRRQLVAQLVAWTHGPYKRKKIIIALLVIDGTNDFYLVGMGGACLPEISVTSHCKLSRLNA